MTASPAKLVCMLYDKAILSLREAILAIEAGEIETRWRANKKTYEIVSHMWATLDREKGGKIAENLDKLFSYILRRLPDVDMKNDPEPAREVIALLEPLRQSWRDVVTGADGATARPGETAQPELAPAATPALAGPQPAPAAIPTSFSA